MVFCGFDGLNVGKNDGHEERTREGVEQFWKKDDEVEEHPYLDSSSASL